MNVELFILVVAVFAIGCAIGSTTVSMLHRRALLQPQLLTNTINGDCAELELARCSENSWLSDLSVEQLLDATTVPRRELLRIQHAICSDLQIPVEAREAQLVRKAVFHGEDWNQVMAMKFNTFS